MRITDEVIDRVLAEIVDDDTDNLYEFSDNSTWVTMTVAEIRGASMLAERLKAVLKE